MQPKMAHSPIHTALDAPGNGIYGRSRRVLGIPSALPYISLRSAD